MLRRRRRRGRGAVAVSRCGSSVARAAPTPPDLVAPAAFDYYVLTLSWSPGFCDTAGARKSPEQCGSGVWHGLRSARPVAR